MDPRLYRCARRGDVRTLKRLLNESPSLVLRLTPQANSIVHIASQFRHQSVVQEICTQFKSLLVKPNVDGDTPLHVAARAGHLGAVSSLLKLIIDEPSFDMETRLEMLRWGNKRDNTALHEAIRNGHSQVVDLLIRANPELLNYENQNGESPLYLAAQGGMAEIVNKALTFPTASIGGCCGKRALHSAVIERHSMIVQSLLRARPELIKAMDNEGRTALHYAASSGDHKMVTRLLEFDTSAAYVMDKDGRSPLHAAALAGHTRVIGEILLHCPDSGELSDLNGQNAPHLAVLSGKAKVVSYMLEMAELQGLMNQPDKKGNMPLHLAAMERKTWIMRHLLWDGRVDRRAQNMYGLTALDIDKTIEIPSTIADPSFWRQPCGMNAPHRFSLEKAHSIPDREDGGAMEQTYKQRVQSLLMITTLITTIAYAAAFTMPGGYNNNPGPNQGVALLQSSKYFKQFIVSDTIAMSSSITAACVILWGAVVGKRSHAYCYLCATVLTYVALLSTATAFTTGIAVVLPDEDYVHKMTIFVGGVIHISTCLFLFGLARIVSVSDVCVFFISRIRKLNRRICTGL